MGVTVGELQVAFDGETKKLRSEIKSLDKRLDRFGKSATKSTAKASKGFTLLRKNISKIGAPIAGLLATLGPAFLVSAVKNAAAFGDNIAKTADRIGIGTESLQELGFAATQSGVDLNILESSLGAFSKRLGEARAGKGAIATQLKDANPELLKMLTTTTDIGSALDILADEIMNTESELDQAALASAAFSRAGLSMVNMLRKGATGIRDMRDKAREMGLVLDDHMIRKSEKVTDQFDILNRKLGTTFKQILIDLGPTIVEFADRFGTFAQNLGFLVSKFREIEEISTQQIQAEVVDLSGEISEMQKEIALLRETMGGTSVGAWIDDMMGANPEEVIERTEKALGELQDRLARGEAELGRRRAQKLDPTGGDEPGFDTGDDSKTQLADEAAGLEAAKALQAELRNERLASRDVLLGEIDLIDQQIAAQQALVVAEGEAAEIRQGNLDALAAKRAMLQAEFHAAKGDEIALEGVLGLELAKTKAADVERVAVILEALRARQLEAEGAVESTEALKEAILDLRELQDEPPEDKGPTSAQKLGDSVAGAVGSGLLRGMNSALSGEGVDIAQTFSDIFADIFNDAMTDIIGGLAKSLSESLSGVLEGLGGEGFGQTLGAAVGVGGALLMGGLQKSESSQSFNQQQSAVQSAQEIRGVVAGPTSIPIAQVGNAIRDAGALQLGELQLHTSLLQQIRDNISGLGSGAGGASIDFNASQTLGG